MTTNDLHYDERKKLTSFFVTSEQVTTLISHLKAKHIYADRLSFRSSICEVIAAATPVEILNAMRDFKPEAAAHVIASAKPAVAIRPFDHNPNR